MRRGESWQKNNSYLTNIEQQLMAKVVKMLVAKK
jgi:hypothetical protein